MAKSIEVSRLFYTIDAETRGLQAEVDKSEKIFGRLTTFIKNNPVAALGSLATAAGAAAIKLADMAADFEHQMAEVGTLVDTTTVDMKKLADGVLDLFRSMPVGTLDEMTKGLYNIISAGVPAAEAIDFLRIASEAAIGGVTDVNTAVDGLTTATNAFASQGLTAADAADAMFTAVKLGKTTFGELSSSMGNVAGLANSLGISFDDLLANTAALTLGGLNTSQAMNSLRQVLANVAKPTAELKQSYPDLAKEFDLTALKTKGLTGFMQDLAERIGGNSDAAIKMFGSVEALNAVLTLTANGGAKVAEITEAMTTKAGAAQAAYDKMADTTENLHKVLRNQLNAELINLGTKILPVVNAGLQALVAWMQYLNGSLGKIEQNAAVGAIEAFGRSIEKFSAPAQRQAIEEISRSLDKVFRLDLSGLPVALKKVSDEELPKLARGLGDVLASTELTEGETRRFAEALGLVYKEAGKRGVSLVATDTKAVGTTAAAATPNVVALGEGTKKAGKDAKDTAKELADLRGEMADTFAKTTRTLIDDTALAIKRFEDRAKAVKMPQAEMEAFTRAMREQGEALETVRITSLYTNETLASPHPARELENIRSVTAQLLEKIKGLKPGTEAYNVTLAELHRLKKIEFDLEDRIKKLKLEQRDLNDDAIAQGVADIRNSELSVTRKQELLAELLGITEEQAKQLLQQDDANGKTRTMVEQVAAVAQGALGLAQSFGIVDDRAASALQSVIGIATNIGAAMAGKPDAIIGVVGSAANLLNTLFGDNPQAAERKRVLQEHGNRLMYLAERTGDLVNAMSPGRVLEGSLGVLESILAPDGRPRQDQRLSLSEVTAALSAQGISLAEFKQVAEDFGFGDWLKDGKVDAQLLRMLMTALRTADTGAGQSFSGRLRSLDDSLAFGITSRDDEFAKLLGLTEGSAISRVLGDLSPDMPGFRQIAAERLKKLFGDLERGDLTTGDFGSMSRSQFSAMIGRLLGILASDQAVGPTTPQTPPTEIVEADPPPPYTPPESAPDPETPEDVIGNGMADLTSIGETTNDYLDEILASINSFKPVAPPSLASIAPQAGQTAAAPGGGVTVGAINLTVNMLPGEQLGDPAVVQRHTEALLDQFDEALARRRSDAATYRGDAGRA